MRNCFSYHPARISFIFKFILMFQLMMALAYPATAQVVGGDLYYSNISPGKYEITLNVFSSCLDKTASETQTIVAFESQSYKAFPPLQLKLQPSETKATILPVPCSQQQGCIALAVYKGQMNLMPVIGGYNIVWSSCCIQSVIANVNVLKRTGFNLLAHIPGNDITGSNSMPAFNEIPVTSVCKNLMSIINLAGVDKDGDSLVYELQTPFAVNSPQSFLANSNMDSRANNMLPAPPPYPSMQLSDGYSEAEPLGKKAIRLNNKNGILQIVPSVPGNYLLGFCIKEYRKSNLLSTHQRVILITVNP